MTKSLSLTKTSLAVALALSFPMMSAHAAESYRAQDVVVTASRVEQQLADVNMSVSVITSEDIERSSGAQTIADLLESKVPGIRINNDGGQGIDRIKIRGEDAFRTVVMVDGQRISEQKSMSGVPLLIDPSQVERIEVIRGPASVLYGSDAIGGAINIITKKGGKKPLEASVSTGFNSSSNGKDASFSISGSHEGWNYRLGAGIQDHDDLDTPAGKMPHTDFSAKSADLFLSYDIDANKTIGISASHYDLDFSSGSITYANPDDFWVEVPEWKRTRGAIFGEFKNLTDNLVRLRIDVGHEQNKKLMTNHVGDSMSMGPIVMPYYVENNADNKLNTTSASIQTDWQLGENHYLITGYEFSLDDLDANSSTYLSLMNNTMSSKDFDGKMTRHSVFATMDSSISDALSVNYGLRYTWFDSEMDIKVKKGSSSDSSNDGSDGKVVFNLGATWKPVENLSLRANWSQGYRYPLLQELYVDTSMGMSGGSTLANPDLKPETSNNFEIGSRYSNGTLTLDAALFYSDADDYITTIPITDEISQYTNVGKAKTIGFELDGSVKLGNFEPYTTLTLLRREYQENGIKTTKSGTPKVTARYGVRYNTSYDSADLRADVYAISQSATESHDMVAEKPTITSYGGATTFNITGGASFGPQNAYSLDVGFYNITDKKYQNNGSIYEPGRHFAVKLNAKF